MRLAHFFSAVLITGLLAAADCHGQGRRFTLEPAVGFNIFQHEPSLTPGPQNYAFGHGLHAQAGLSYSISARVVLSSGVVYNRAILQSFGNYYDTVLKMNSRAAPVLKAHMLSIPLAAKFRIGSGWKKKPCFFIEGGAYFSTFLAADVDYLSVEYYTEKRANSLDRKGADARELKSLLVRPFLNFGIESDVTAPVGVFLKHGYIFSNESVFKDKPQGEVQGNSHLRGWNVATLGMRIRIGSKGKPAPPQDANISPTE